MPTTEIAVFSMKTGADIGDPDNQAASIAKDTFETLNTIEGMQQIHFGPSIENPSKMQLMISWEKFQHHKDFMASSTYQPFLQRWMSIVDGDPHMMHADFKPEGNLNKCFSAPATEVATFYFDGAPPSNYFDNARVCLEEKVKGTRGLLAWAVGITHEELEFDGGKGKAAVLVIGWESKEIHEQFRQTQAFKDNIHLLRSNAKKVNMDHVRFMQYQA